MVPNALSLSLYRVVAGEVALVLLLVLLFVECPYSIALPLAVLVETIAVCVFETIRVRGCTWQFCAVVLPHLED